MKEITKLELIALIYNFIQKDPSIGRDISGTSGGDGNTGRGAETIPLVFNTNKEGGFDKALDFLSEITK